MPHIDGILAFDELASAPVEAFGSGIRSSRSWHREQRQRLANVAGSGPVPHGCGPPMPFSAGDLLATLTELTARLVAVGCRAHRLNEVVLAGGAVRNPTLMRSITDLAARTRVRLIDEYGLPAQAKEAYFTALLGDLSIHGHPGTMPSSRCIAALT